MQENIRVSFISVHSVHTIKRFISLSVYMRYHQPQRLTAAVYRVCKWTLNVILFSSNLITAVAFRIALILCMYWQSIVFCHPPAISAHHCHQRYS